MAINRGVLGTQTGSMGGITASNWKGRNVYKQKVPATNSSNTPAQQVQRRKFALLAKLAGIFGPQIRVGFRMAAAKVTEQNAFVTANYGFVEDDGQTATMDFTQMVIGTGIVLAPSGLALAWNAATRVADTNWSDNSNGADGLPTDIAYGAIYDSSTGAIYPLPAGATRTDGGSASFPAMPAGTDVQNLRLYVFFKRASDTTTSPSRYAHN